LRRRAADMHDPWPIHLTTNEEQFALGWAYVARDGDDHMIRTYSDKRDEDDSGAAQFIGECLLDGITVHAKDGRVFRPPARIPAPVEVE
ncbi:MAG: hypothetical protein AAF737_07235, partial [Pseudomonadota bacterium]